MSCATACSVFSAFCAAALFFVARMVQTGYRFTGEFMPEYPPGTEEGTPWTPETAATYRKDAANNVYAVAATYVFIAVISAAATCLNRSRTA
ncbi:hypothetical protein NFJ02_09g139830 [Pycnococcus provasolii]